MKHYGLLNYLDVSTGHITEADDKFLRTDQYDQQPLLIVDTHENGYWIHTPSEKIDMAKVLDSDQISESLKKILLKAVNLNATYVRLDSIGMEHPDLDVHDW